jgi:regulator of telomere elongation helicase 1
VNAAKPRTLSFWCFSPGIAIKEFEAHGTHSIILTSGTLHPLESFAAELSIKLPVRLQNAHVIAANQLWCGVVRKGPGGHTLNSSYANRSDPGYQRDLGNAIVNFCRIVPNGVLVFFPSYGVMRACIGTWQGGDPGKTVWDRIRQYKAAVIEPQDKHEFSAAMSEFYARVNDPRTKGAVFFAVCRGKVSEGLDFANENGRAVIITGLPYPPFKVVGALSTLLGSVICSRPRSHLERCCFPRVG